MGSVYERALTNGHVTLRYSTTNRYEPRLFQTTQSYDTDGDGTNDYVSIFSQTYDKHGNSILSVQDFDFNTDGITDQRNTTTYAKLSRSQFLELTKVEGIDGKTEQTITATQTVNHGQFVSVVTDYDTNADGTIDWRLFDSWTYDNRDNPIFYLHQEDYGNNGKKDATLQISYGYDNRGNQISSTLEFDWDGDGIPDETTTTSNTYNNRGLLLQSNSRDSTPLYPFLDSTSETTLHTTNSATCWSRGRKNLTPTVPCEALGHRKTFTFGAATLFTNRSPNLEGARHNLT